MTSQGSNSPPVDTSSFAKKAEVPAAATNAPPSVADASAVGTEPMIYALANHTHASKARKIRANSDASGLLVWTFDPPFTPGTTPRVVAIAETSGPAVTDVVNVQIEGLPTSTSCNLRVNRTARSVVALLGLTILSVPSSPGVTMVHAVALEP